jgi:hypothetical protein
MTEKPSTKRDKGSDFRPKCKAFGMMK